VRRRLGIFVGEWAGGGVERVTTNFLAHVDRDRWEPTLLIACRPEEGFGVPQDVEVVQLRARRLRYALPALARHLRRSPPEILLSHMTLPSSYSLIARRLTGGSYPIVCVEHNTLSVEYRHARGLRAQLPRLLRVTHPWADAVVTVSHASKRDLADLLGGRTLPIHVIYNPIVPDDVDQRAAAPPAHPWLGDSGLRVVLSACRLAPQKNLGLLVDAFAAVAREEPAARLVILGEGEERASLERRIAKLRLDGVTALPGFVAEPYPSLRRAAVFAMSSHYEGLPTALVEAMAAGTPVVATDSPGGVREIVGDGRYGLLTPPGDATALAEGILSVLRGSSWPPEELRAWTGQFRAATGAATYDQLLQEVLQASDRDEQPAR
jgi:glycosyltransferase involved in cell wall biosynthesis